MKFKIGDKIRTTVELDDITKDKIYTVTSSNDEEEFVRIIDDAGDRHDVFECNFTLVSKRTKKQQLKEQEKISKKFLVVKKSCMNYVTLCDSEKLAKDYIKDNDLSDEHIIFSMKEVLRSNKVSKIRFTTIKKKGKKK